MTLSHAGVVLIGLALATPGSARAQALTADASSSALLDRITEDAARYRAAVPSLAADESFTVTGMRFGRTVEGRSNLRVVRKPDGTLQESRETVEFMGKPVPEGKPVHPAYVFTGAFGNGLEAFFSAEQRPCYVFVLAPEPLADRTRELRFSARADLSSLPNCGHTLPGTTGLVRIDPATGQIRHLERTIPTAFARPRHVASFVSVDYENVPVGTETFWLPVTIVARPSVDSGDAIELRYRYSNYHRFTGTLRILPDATAPIQPQPR